MKMIVKVQYRNQKKYIKIPEACFDIFITEDTISVTLKSSSENDFYSGTLKRFRKEEEALQGPQAKNLIKQVLLTKPGGSDVLKEYEEKGTISSATRKVMVNILVADMVQSEGRIPQRLTKEKYALGIVTLFPSLQDPHGKTGYRMIIPSLDKGVKVCSKSRDKDVVHTKEVNHIRDIKQTIFLQRVKNIM
ncbi:hypothetical protein JOQ06_019659, partial [Pogonophryne albipinna]